MKGGFWCPQPASLAEILDERPELRELFPTADALDTAWRWGA